MPAVWSVYLLRCSNGALYCGISNDPPARFTAHLQGRGARYTKMFPPQEMRTIADGLSRVDAARREAAVKRLPAAEKRRLWSAGQPVAIPRMQNQAKRLTRLFAQKK